VLLVHQQWIQQQKGKYTSILFENYTRNCLTQFDRFSGPDLIAKVIRLNGVIRSFGFAGEMRAGLGNIYMTYSNHSVDGLNKFLIYKLLREMDQLEFMNSGNAGNAGDSTGFAKVKQALMSVSMHTTYQIYAGRPG